MMNKKSLNMITVKTI